MGSRTVLVCGGRTYDDQRTINYELDLLHSRLPIGEIIEGGAKGADECARTWAWLNDVSSVSYVANWKTMGRSAGPIRNQRMLDEGKPSLVVAFPGGRGTADMVRRAKAAGIEVLEISDSAAPPTGAVP